MLLADEPNIREVIVFPLNQRAEDLLMQAPAPVPAERLKELSIKLDLPKPKVTAAPERSRDPGRHGLAEGRVSAPTEHETGPVRGSALSRTGPVSISGTSTQHPPITLNSTLRSSASVASSRPVPIRLSRAPMPLAMVRSVSAGSSWLSRVFTYSARRSDSRSFSGAGPVGLVWPATSRQDGLRAARVGDGVEPAVVIPAHLRVRDEGRRSRPEQELDRQPVVAQPVIDDIAERLSPLRRAGPASGSPDRSRYRPATGRPPASAPPPCKGPEPLHSGRRHMPRSRRLSGTRSGSVQVAGRYRIADLGTLAGGDIALRRLVAGPGRAVLEKRVGVVSTPSIRARATPLATVLPDLRSAITRQNR